MEEKGETLSIRVVGKVQGVSFRASAAAKARQLGIKGWVKNEQDGSVQIVATGTGLQLTSFTEWCKEGPTFARVQNVEVTQTAYSSFTDFTIES